MDFGSIDDFVTAASAAGIDCSVTRPNSLVSGADASVDCGDDWGLSLFPTVDKRNHVLQLNQDSQEPGVFLVGPNWLLTKFWGDDGDLTPPQSGLGRIIWKADSPIPTT